NNNVYAAELTGIQLAMTTMEHSPPQYQKCVIYADNQSAISAIFTPERQSGQYILCDIHEHLDRMLEHKPNLTFHIEWVPGHMDIHGNDTADEEAKRAAKEKIQGDNPFNIHKLKSSQNMTINASIAKATKTAWSSRNTKNKQARQHTRPQRIKT